ncbi:MAG: cold shock domain-containing protein [Patescibacteria group bacterium]
MQGIIKKKTERGFGFISAQGMEKDLFFHSNALVGVSFDELQEGDAVEFDIEDSQRGGPNGEKRQNAVNVKRV